MDFRSRFSNVMNMKANLPFDDVFISINGVLPVMNYAQTIQASSVSLSLSFQNPSSNPKLATNHFHFRSVSKELVDLLNGPRVGNKMKVKLLRILFFNLRASFVLISWWHAVSSWTWDAQDETCGICRLAFDGCCPDCKHPGDDCPLIWGECNHAFHLHCILKWVNSQTPQAHCPMCRREWQFKG
ncbi:Anaphase-promoting complex subunit 11 [Camellia lanceoleosa]|uniref:Anaphase-promoting complex subunit 11 n=1 Tax=Camellia lanceoleosa TaxID=1840588 RepID=A0ACC0IAC0_9ERIC|nr:Anaphase-promoting complex subunit 11 [Camellia lanceoleosa]